MARFSHPALVSFGSFLLALPACSSSRSDEAAKPDVPAYCRDPGYPAPPRARKMGGSIEFVVAERTRDAGDARGPGGPTYLTTGFNLDRTCTGALEGQSCERPSWATAVVDDGPRG